MLKVFKNCLVPDSLKSGIILIRSKTKGKGHKDNYRGITSFSALIKTYNMVLLNRLENYVSHKGLFSEIQFSFQEIAGSIEWHVSPFLKP